MRQRFPRRKEAQRSLGRACRARDIGILKPRLNVLVIEFLGFEAIGDDDNGASWKQARQEHCQKRVGRRVNHVERRKTPMLHAPKQRLRSGSRQNDRELPASRYMVPAIAQTKETLAGEIRSVKLSSDFLPPGQGCSKLAPLIEVGMLPIPHF